MRFWRLTALIVAGAGVASRAHAAEPFLGYWCSETVDAEEATCIEITAKEIGSNFTTDVLHPKCEIDKVTKNGKNAWTLSTTCGSLQGKFDVFVEAPGSDSISIARGEFGTPEIYKRASK